MVFLIRCFFVILFVEGLYHHVSNAEKEIAALACESATALAPASDRASTADQRKASACLCDPSKAPQQRSGFPSSHHSRDGDPVRCRLEMFRMLENKQGQYEQVCQMWHKVDTRVRSNVYASEAVQESQATVVELCGLADTRWMARLVNPTVGRHDTAACQNTEGQQSWQYTQKAQQREEGQARCTWSTRLRSTVALQLCRRSSHEHRQRGHGHTGEVGSSCNCAPSIQHPGECQCPEHCQRVLSPCPISQRAESRRGQDGQSAQKAQGGRESQTEPAHVVEALHSGFPSKMDEVHREVRRGRSRACGEGQVSQRTSSKDEGGRGQQEGGTGRLRRGGPHRHLRRRDDRESGCLRSDPGQPEQHGGKSAESTEDCRCSHCGGRREQGQKTKIGRAGHCIGKAWRSFFCIASAWSQGFRAFWQAGQVVSTEACPGHSEGSCAVLLNWSHSFVEDPDFQSVWEASIQGLDLAWEVGTLTSHCGPTSAEGLSRRVLASAKDRQVKFEETVELYVGDEDSTCFALHPARLGR